MSLHDSLLLAEEARLVRFQGTKNISTREVIGDNLNVFFGNVAARTSSRLRRSLNSVLKFDN